MKHDVWKARSIIACRLAVPLLARYPAQKRIIRSSRRRTFLSQKNERCFNGGFEGDRVDYGPMLNAGQHHASAGFRLLGGRMPELVTKGAAEGGDAVIARFKSSSPDGQACGKLLRSPVEANFPGVCSGRLAKH